MFEQSQQFYPTPKEVISQILEGMKLNFPVLDPSAGKGDILEYLAESRKYQYRKNELYAIEIDPELRMILKEKDFKVLDADFLAFHEPLEFGTIIMNPPFNDADSHILHAWNFVAEGGELIALCNAETVNNPYTKQRQVLAHLIETYGSSESLGACFANAERPTDVEIALVKLTKPKTKSKTEFDDSKFTFDAVEDANFEANPLASSNYLESLVSQYKRAESILIQRQKLNSELAFYLKGIASARDRENYLPSAVPLVNELSVLKERFWDTVFNKARIASKITGSFQRDFDKFRSEQKSMSFTVANVQEMLLMFFGNYNEIMNKCLVEMFDTLTKYHAENRVHTEGWVTNKGYRLNKKVIHPYGVELRDYSGFCCYRSRELLCDLDKIMCWLEGIKYEELTNLERTYDILSSHCTAANKGDVSYTEKMYSRYFIIKMFKKGTIHLTFRDEKLLNDFNIKAAQGKMWIGGEGF